MRKKDYYRILHVQPDAPVEIIRASYLVLMRDLKQHPDLGGEQMTAALLNEAYETLNDPGKRAEYDRGSNVLHFHAGSGAVLNANLFRAVPFDKGTPAAGDAEGGSDAGCLCESGSALNSAAAPLTCAVCNTGLRRIRRSWWMRLLMDTKLYVCPDCKKSFLYLMGLMFRYPPMKASHILQLR